MGLQLTSRLLCLEGVGGRCRHQILFTNLGACAAPGYPVFRGARKRGFDNKGGRKCAGSKEIFCSNVPSDHLEKITFKSRCAVTEPLNKVSLAK